MCSKILTTKSTENYWSDIRRLKEVLECADAIVIGAGAGLSTSAGHSYTGERFLKYFADFHEAYGIRDMYSGGFYPFRTLEEKWAWWSRQIYCNRYESGAGKPYTDLLQLVEGKNYFVITTNVDHQFQKAGFDKQRLFYTQGDYGLWQCSVPCHLKTYDNEVQVREMVARQENMRIPAELIPTCPRCGKPMEMNLRADERFVEDEGWHKASGRYHEFIRRCQGVDVVYLELGVGGNTPGIIKYPFWRMTIANENATYVCINYGEASAPDYMADQAICINEDIGKVLEDVLAL